MIDVHIILYNIKQNYFDECLNSLKTNKNIVLHFLYGYKDNIGLGRYEGFQKGTNEYVAFVDPDDYPEPMIFDEILNFIKNKNLNNFCGIYTYERKINEIGDHIAYNISINREWKRFDIRSSWIPHHVCVMKREYVEKYLDEIKKWKYRSEYILRNLISLNGDWILYPKVGYNWRIHKNNTHNQKHTHIYTRKSYSFIQEIFNKKDFESGKQEWLSNSKNMKWYLENIEGN